MSKRKVEKIKQGALLKIAEIGLSGFKDVIKYLSIASVANPVSAAVCGGILIRIFQRLGVLDELSANALFALAIGVAGAEAGAGLIDQIIPDLGGRGDANSYPDKITIVLGESKGVLE